MKIVFKELTLKDFKGLRDYHLDFDDDLTALFADNAQGKTTIVHSLFWLFFGKDANGSSKFELFPLDKDNNLIEDTIPTVTLKFVHGAKENVYTRSKKGSATSYLINGDKVKAGEYKRHVSSVVTEELFSALLSPVFFGDNYTWQKQRDTILGNMRFENTIIDSFEYEDVAEKLLEDGIDQTLALYEKERKTLEKSKEQYIGTRDYLANKLEGVDTSITQEELVKQKGLKQQEIKEAEAALDSLHPIQTEMSRLEREIQKKESDVTALIRQKESDMQNIKRESDSKAKSLRREKELEISSLIREKDKLLAQYKKESADLKEVKDKCPLCGSDLDAFTVSIQKDEFKKKINEIKIQGTTKAEEIEKLKAELLAIKPEELPLKQITSIEKEVEELRAQGVAEGEKGDLLALKQKEKEIREKVDYEKIQALRQELSAIEKQVSDYEYVVKDKKDLDDTIKKLRGIMEDYDDADDIIEAIKKYRTDYAQMIADALNAKLDRVKIKTFNIVKDEPKETFEVSMDGVPYSSLNSAGKIEAGIELIQLLSESLDICFPIVIDNKESITRDFDIPNQLITLSVKKGAKLIV